MSTLSAGATFTLNAAAYLTCALLILRLADGWPSAGTFVAAALAGADCGGLAAMLGILQDTPVR